MKNFTEEIKRFIDEKLQQRARLIEEACEASIQEGKYGILVIERNVIYNQSFNVIMLQSFEVRVDPSVPYGHIYYKQKEENDEQNTPRK